MRASSLLARQLRNGGRRTASLRLARGATLAALLLTSTARAEPDARIQLGLASEHGAGLGAGLELGDGPTTLVVGLGVASALGYSSVDGWQGSLTPGVGLGLRRYVGGFYVGPTIGAGYTVWATTPAVNREGTWSAWAAADVGYRWRLGADDRPLKLGLAVGAERNDGEDGLFLALALSLGF